MDLTDGGMGAMDSNTRPAFVTVVKRNTGA